MPPQLVAVSLGAGVQSTTMSLLAIDGVLPKPDVAIFADTGWEPAEVYAHLERLEAELDVAGIPVRRVARGNIREEEPDPHFVQRIPLFIRDPAGGRGSIAKRQCTSHYKLVPIHREIRRLLGATARSSECRYCQGAGSRVTPWSVRQGTPQTGRCSVCGGDGVRYTVGAVPRDAGGYAEQWVGFSVDEIGRADGGKNDPAYVRTRYPLLELGWSRARCESYLADRGWGSTPKSACIGCPFHGNAQWRRLRDEHPDEWADAVAFDEAIRSIPGASNVVGEGYLHRAMVPLRDAPIDVVSSAEWRARQGDLLVDAQLLEDGDPDGCSPHACRSGEAVAG